MHKCDIVFVCSLPWYDLQRTERYGFFLYTNREKVNEQGSSKNSRSKDSRGDSQMDCWYDGSEFSCSIAKCFSSFSLFSQSQEGSFEVQRDPSHSRLRMNSSRSGDEVMLNYELISLLLKSELMDANLRVRTIFQITDEQLVALVFKLQH